MANSTPSLEPEVPPATARQPQRRALSLILFGGAAALAMYAVYSYQRIDPVGERVAVTPLTEPAELVARQHDVIGTFATGPAPGDRTLAVAADGTVEFVEIGADPASGRIKDTYRIARRGKTFCLTTAASGLIDIVNIDTMVYGGDTYRRTK
ncbi:MAG: hypothetical protein Q7S40_10805 [Opitutaceae bacterium]|nr:hypothetical protein [Opitutaceae bacterium]